MILLLLSFLFFGICNSSQVPHDDLVINHYHYFLPSECGKKKKPQYIYHYTTPNTINFFSLLYLIQHGYDNIIQSLLKNTFIPNNYFFTKHAQSALHIACYPNTVLPKTLQNLIKYPYSLMDINQNTYRNATPLHIVAQYNQLDKCRILLTKKSINLDLQNKERQTALHIAALKGYLELISLLIDHGADPWIRCKNNKLAWHYAAQNNYHKVKKTLWYTMFPEDNS